MRARDLALVALGAGLGALGAGWLAGRDAVVPSEDGAPGAEVRALRARVATLEEALADRPAPLAVALPPSHGGSAPRGADAPPATATAPDAGVEGTDAQAVAATLAALKEARAQRAAAADAALAALQRGGDREPLRVRLGPKGELSVVNEGEPTPPPTADDVRRWLDSGTDEDLVRAAEAAQALGDRTFLRDLVDRVNRPEHASVARRLLGPISSLKDRPWSALQATGAPDTPVGGDHGTAWASKQPEMGAVVLELTYDRAVRPDAVRIHETLGAGAVVKIEAQASDGTFEVLWEGLPTGRATPSWFDPPLAPFAGATSRLRITVDTDRVPGWNELDAVELVGDGGRQWASGATATSSYADP